MSDQSESDEKSEAESRFEFGKASRRTFLSRLGMASLIASAGSITPAFGERSGQGQISSSESKDAVPVSLRVNGKKYDLRIDPRTSLLDCLREHLHLTGSKKGCDHGQCGACTVHVNGRRVNSCLCLAVMHEDEEITTIEGIGSRRICIRCRRRSLTCDAFQCGYCTSGQIMSAVALLEGTVRDGRCGREGIMSGNICRCGAYHNIVAAIQSVRQNAEPQKAG